jgi:hypothetical protein
MEASHSHSKRGKAPANSRFGYVRCQILQLRWYSTFLNLKQSFIAAYSCLWSSINLRVQNVLHNRDCCTSWYGFGCSTDANFRIRTDPGWPTGTAHTVDLQPYAQAACANGYSGTAADHSKSTIPQPGTAIPSRAARYGHAGTAASDEVSTSYAAGASATHTATICASTCYSAAGPTTTSSFRAGTEACKSTKDQLCRRRAHSRRQ